MLSDAIIQVPEKSPTGLSLDYVNEYVAKKMALMVAAQGEVTDDIRRILENPVLTYEEYCDSKPPEHRAALIELLQPGGSDQINAIVRDYNNLSPAERATKEHIDELHTRIIAVLYQGIERAS